MTRRLLALPVVLAAVAAAIPAAARSVGAGAGAPAQISLEPTEAAFTTAGLVPGDRIIRCLRVRNAGSLPAAVVAFPVVVGDLFSHLRVTAELGAGLRGPDASCAGFVPTGRYAFGSRAGGVPVTALTPDADAAWAPGHDRSYRITISLPPTVGNGAQGRRADAAFVWLAGTAAAGPGGATADPTSAWTDAQLRELAAHVRIDGVRVRRDGSLTVRVWAPLEGSLQARALIPRRGYSRRARTRWTYGQTLGLRIAPGPSRVRVRPGWRGRRELRRARRTGDALRGRVQVTYRTMGGADVRRHAGVSLVR